MIKYIDKTGEEIFIIDLDKKEVVRGHTIAELITKKSMKNYIRNGRFIETVDFEELIGEEKYDFLWGLLDKVRESLDELYLEGMKQAPGKRIQLSGSCGWTTVYDNGVKDFTFIYNKTGEGFVLPESSKGARLKKYMNLIGRGFEFNQLFLEVLHQSAFPGDYVFKSKGSENTTKEFK